MSIYQAILFWSTTNKKHETLMKTTKHKKIRETSPSTKPWNPAHNAPPPSSQARHHPLHKTSIYSKLIMLCIDLNISSSACFLQWILLVYINQRGGNPPRATRRPLAKNKYLKLSLRLNKVQGTKYPSKIYFQKKIAKKDHFQGLTHKINLLNAHLA